MGGVSFWSDQLEPGPSRKGCDATTRFPRPVGLDWVPKCREIIANVQKGLKSDAHWFMDRVDEKLVPDYYKVIKNPMW